MKVYRVENLEALVNELRKEGVKILDGIKSFKNGRFVQIIDAQGNTVQLWEAHEY